MIEVIAPARIARWPSWVAVVLASVLAVAVGLLGAVPASAVASPSTYDTVAYTYDATARLSTPHALVEAGLGSPTGPGAASWVSPVSVGGVVVAANGAADLTRALSYSTKIEGQMAARGWSQAAIQATVKSPETTHNLWDLTSGAKQAATAYVQRGGGYVVVNNETGAVVQISNLNKAGWKVPWEDPRFIR